ncbi:17513_t:CDS:2, partial [Gigaspora rosea]
LQTAHIADSSLILEPIRVERGVLQGDPLSPLLYILALNPLILKIQEELNGIKAAGQFFKVIAYADDLTLVLLLQKYELASNAKINQKKSILVPLTNMAKATNLLDQNLFKVAEDVILLRILGYEIDSRGTPKKQL